MRTLESYHILGFIVAYLSLYKSYELTLPDIKIQNNVYILCAIAPLLALCGSTDCNSLEHLTLVLAYAFFIRGMSVMFALKSDPKYKIEIENYAHMIFIISLLMLIYNNKVQFNIAYPIMIVFSAVSLMANKTTINYCMNDYILLHLLFFFTK